MFCRMRRLINASSTFMAGPARATHIIPRLGFSKFAGLTGTGFAHPMPKPCSMLKMKTKSPRGSRCLMGFMVRRPSILAVGSPSLWATQPWASSWRVMARSMAGRATMTVCTALALTKKNLSHSDNS